LRWQAKRKNKMKVRHKCSSYSIAPDSKLTINAIYELPCNGGLYLKPPHVAVCVIDCKDVIPNVNFGYCDVVASV